jgi:hypothetical protein
MGNNVTAEAQSQWKKKPSKKALEVRSYVIQKRSQGNKHTDLRK